MVIAISKPVIMNISSIFFSHPLTCISLYWTLPVSVKSASLPEWFVKLSLVPLWIGAFPSQPSRDESFICLVHLLRREKRKEAEGAEEGSICDSPVCPGQQNRIPIRSDNNCKVQIPGQPTSPRHKVLQAPLQLGVSQLSPLRCGSLKTALQL